MTRYALQDLTLEVEQADTAGEEEVDRLLRGLSWSKTGGAAGSPSLSLTVRPGDGSSLPAAAREVLNAGGFRGLESDGDYYLTDGESLLHLRASEGRGEVRLAPSFFSKPYASRHEFWTFALVKLLQGIGVYSLHAAGVVAPDGTGILIVGKSGGGKSTLTIGLIRNGWRYLSDDAVLLRSTAAGVEALAFRRDFYVDSPAAERYAGLTLAEEVPDATGGRRRRIGIEEAYPAQRAPKCSPAVLLFSRIVPRDRSALTPVDRATALARLLAQCASQVFEREATARHLVVLKELLRRTEFYDLEAGRDLYENPVLVRDLVSEARAAARGAN